MAKKILIVEDERDLVEMYIVRLESFGYEVNAAMDSMQAMMQLNKNRPDLVLLDINMPAGGGLTVLKNIRQNIKMFRVPVIIMTGRSDEQTREAAEKQGISGYFVKPVDMDRLKEKIAEIFNENREENSKGQRA